MTARPYNVLFLCTGNSARSILAEVLINHWGKGRFVGYSAGSQPKGEVNPHTLSFLQKVGLPTEGLSSKSWDEFAKPDAPAPDFVITVCDKAAGEVCPAWPGQPMTAHWGVEDPVDVQGSEREIFTAFNKAFRELENRIKIFCNLPIAALDRLSLKRRMDEIGETNMKEADGG
jgi:arsenate reductase